MTNLPWILALAPLTLAADEADEADDWDITEARGPTHPLALDLDEGTWMSVSVHGQTVAFDLLGDLWTIPLAGGVATQITDGPAWDVQPTFSPDGTQLAFTSDRDGNENIWILDLATGESRAFTEASTDARCTHPVWDPTGSWLMYRRRTIDTRSIGVTEIWQKHLQGGDGFALTDKDDHPHAGEMWPTASPMLYFSSRHGRFSYDEDPVAGLWRIVRLDRETGDLRPIAWGPGSAVRPTVSPDGDALYFVSRRRTDTLLERIDLATGDRRIVADWLSGDEMEGFALHGAYPRMDWTDDGDLVLWANGGLWRVDPTTGNRASIGFRATGTWTMHDIVRPRRTVSDTVTARVLRWPTLSARGAWAFSALGSLWVRTPDDDPSPISEGPGFAPAWSPDGASLAWTRWTEADGGSLHVTNRRGRTEVLPVSGQLTNPTWSEDGTALAVLRGPGGSVSADLAREAWYEVVLVEPEGRGWRTRVVTAVDAHWGDRKQRLRLDDGRLYFLSFASPEPRTAEEATLVSVALDGTDRRTHVALGQATDAVVSPAFDRIAYVVGHQLHVAALPPFPRDLDVDALPHEQVTDIVGDWIGWTPDGTEVTWAEGPILHRRPVADLWTEADDAGDEGDEGDEDEVDPLVVALPVSLTVPRARPSGAVVLRNARVLTMAGDDEILEGVDVVVEADRITAVGADLTAPEGATIVDCTDATILPGLIDVHAHLHFSSGDILPEQEWRYEVALDYGVTTVHDPSTLTDLVFTQAEMVAAGRMRGPRVYSTGSVLYGALGSENAVTDSLDAAHRHVQRLKASGATSVKVYQQSQRRQRQWYLDACEAHDMLCVPEGGGDLWMDLGMIVDGYPAMEHALPTAPLYRDVLSLLAGSTVGGDGLGTFYTPTLQVAYGGMGAQHYFVQRDFPVDDPWLRRHTPARQLEAQLWRGDLVAHPDDWRFQQTARDAAAVQDAGGHVTLGAHGELQGLGVHWELWALAGPGALSPHDALATATIEGARYLGLDASLGSVEVGKLADLLVVRGDPLEDLTRTTEIHAVLKNGEVVVSPQP